MKVFNEDWFNDKRQATSRDVEYISEIISEEIDQLDEGIRKKPDGGVDIDYEMDNPEDFIRFYDQHERREVSSLNTTVHQLGGGAIKSYVGFVFITHDQSLAQNATKPLATAIRALRVAIPKVERIIKDPHNLPVTGPTQEHTSKLLANELNETHLKTLSDNVPDIFKLIVSQDGTKISSIFRGIYDYLEENPPFTNFSVRELQELVRNPRVARDMPNRAELEAAYAGVKKDIITRLNKESGSPFINEFISFGAKRLVSYIKRGKLGFTPNVLVLPVSAKLGTARPLINYLATEIKKSLSVDIVEGLTKNNKDVVYHDKTPIALTDSNGKALPDIPNIKVGYKYLPDVAVDIEQGRFKITSIYEPNRRFFKNFMKIAPGMAKAVQDYTTLEEPMRVLALDDCIYSGVTQKNSAAALQQFAKSKGVDMEIATYALIATTPK